MRKVACVGILVADVIIEPVNTYPEKGFLQHVNSITLHNGGNAMTAAVNLKKLGNESVVVGKVGADMFGAFLKERLTEAGVSTKALKTDDMVQTSASVVLLDESGERSFLHCVGTNAVFSIKDIDFDSISDCDMVFVTGSFLLNTFDGQETADFLKKCKELGKTTFLDVCWDASNRWGEVLNCAMPYIDYFMPSIDEAENIAKAKDPDEIADVFIKNGVKNVVIKMGGNGSYLRLEGEDKGKIYPALKGIKAIDTTGAGDSFCSGFLAAYARGESAEKCVEFANATGAICVMHKGATTGTKSYEDTLKFLEEMK